MRTPSAVYILGKGASDLAKTPGADFILGYEEELEEYGQEVVWAVECDDILEAAYLAGCWFSRANNEGENIRVYIIEHSFADPWDLIIKLEHKASDYADCGTWIDVDVVGDFHLSQLAAFEEEEAAS